MARNYFNRYIWLIDLIQRSGHISFEEINRAWQYSSLNPNGERLSERTFFNHKDAIFDTFGIEIKCDRSLGYWKSPVRVTPEAQVPLTLESKFRMTPIKS